MTLPIWLEHQPLPRRFGAALRSYRKRLRISQAQLAAIAGMHRTYIGAVERGEKNLSLETMARLAVAVNTPLWMLMFEAERPHESAR
jgi:transcriptional regulator with XRE-family HTH domain